MKNSSWMMAAMAVVVGCSAACGDDDGGGGDGQADAADDDPDARRGDTDASAADADAGRDDDADAEDAGRDEDAGAEDAGVTPDAGGLAACTDPVDQDGDGLGGYPDDPGCASLDDDDESDECPDGLACPACGNGVDDDRDADQDYPGDIGCADAADEDESDTCVPGVEVQPLRYGGGLETLEPGPSYMTTSCYPDTASYPENVHAFRVDEPLEVLNFRIQGPQTVPIFPSVRYGDCADPEGDLPCGVLTVGDPAPGTYYVTMDGQPSGQYSITPEAIVASGGSCGFPVPGRGYDGRCIPTESCDDFTNGGTCRPNQCFDGIDNDGDGRVDWLDDPGCRGAGSVEADACPGPPCATCANEVDDDDDGLVDLADPDCTYSGSDREQARDCAPETDALIEITSANISGTTVGATNDHALEQNFLCGDTENDDGGSPDVMYWIYLPGIVSVLTVTDTGSFFDRIVSLNWEECSYVSRCMESGPSVVMSGQSGYVYIIIDGADGASGDYSLNVHGVYEAGQVCDPAHIDAGIMECAEFTQCIDGLCQY